MKIYVYAICKNEEKFVTRWVNSMNEADGIYVRDTGSTDNTVNSKKPFRAAKKPNNTKAASGSETPKPPLFTSIEKYFFYFRNLLCRNAVID